MLKLASIIATLAAPFAVEAQDTIAVKKDSISFVKSKRILIKMFKSFYHFFLLILLSVCAGCTAMHYIKVPNQNSYKKFPQRKIENADTAFHFHKPSKDYGLGKMIGVTNKDLNPSNVTLDSLMQLHKTIAFVIIRNDTILYEKYKNNIDTVSVSSFSIAKPFISTLIGIAIDEGNIKSVDDKITKYLPEFENKQLWE